MPLNIIIRDKHSTKERTIIGRAREILARAYKTECEHPEKFGLPEKPTKADIKRAWEHDAKGDIDPAL